MNKIWWRKPCMHQHFKVLQAFLIEAREDNSDEKKKSVAISSEAQGCGATFKVACCASRAAISFFSPTFFFSSKPSYLCQAFKNSVVSSNLYLFWVWSSFFWFLFILMLMLRKVFFYQFHLFAFNLIYFLYPIWSSFFLLLFFILFIYLFLFCPFNSFFFKLWSSFFSLLFFFIYFVIPD